MQVGKVIGVREECLEGEKRNFCQGRNEKVRSNFALNLFKQIVSRWIEDQSRSVKH